MDTDTLQVRGFSLTGQMGLPVKRKSIYTEMASERNRKKISQQSVTMNYPVTVNITSTYCYQRRPTFV